MKIILEIPDNSKCFHGCLVSGDVTDLHMWTIGLDTDGLKDGKTYYLPHRTEKKDGDGE